MSLATTARLILTIVLASGAVSAQNAERGSVSTASSRSAAMVQSPPVYLVEPLPPIAPQVICRDGQVTLVALNSTLASVLKAVAGCAGAIVHMPADIGATRMAIKYGPVNAMAMFAVLLDGSADYVILGSQRRPSSVQMVIVRPHQAMTAGAQQAMPVSDKAAAPATFVDEEGVERLMSGLTPEEANLTPEELAQKFEAARQEQKRLDQLTQPPNPQQP